MNGFFNATIIWEDFSSRVCAGEEEPSTPTEEAARERIVQSYFVVDGRKSGSFAVHVFNSHCVLIWWIEREIDEVSEGTFYSNN
jgi:hypothetical protein